MIAILVALFADSVSLQSSPIRGMHVAQSCELVLLYEDMLHTTDDGPIRHWA